MKFEVGVEKRMYATGVVTVECATHDQAVQMVQAQIDSGKLQTTKVKWNKPVYEDCSFTTTGDVNKME